MINSDFTSEGLKQEVKWKLNSIKFLTEDINEDIEEVLRWEFEPYEYEKAIASCNRLQRALIELSTIYDFYVQKDNLDKKENAIETLGDEYV